MLITGFDYNVNVSQVGAVNCGLMGLVDIVDLSIFNSIVKFTNWEGCEWITDQDGRWFWYSWKNVVKRLPFSGLKTRSPIKKRINKLVNCGLLEARYSAPGSQKSYYKFGPKYSQFMNYNEGALKSPRVLNEVHVERVPVLNGGHGRVLNGGHNDSTVNDNTNNSTNVKGQIENLQPPSSGELFGLVAQDAEEKKVAPKKEVSPLEKAWGEWLEYKHKQHRFKYKLESSEAKAKKYLWELSGSDPETAIKIIDQSIANGWKGFQPLKVQPTAKQGEYKGVTGQGGFADIAKLAREGKISIDDDLM